MWELHEQVAIAAMEAGCKELALRLVKNVNKRFPSGTRGSRLTVGCSENAARSPRLPLAVYAGSGPASRPQ